MLRLLSERLAGTGVVAFWGLGSMALIGAGGSNKPGEGSASCSVFSRGFTESSLEGSCSEVFCSGSILESVLYLWSGSWTSWLELEIRILEHFDTV